MKTFVLHLEDATQYERIEGVSSFVGEDDSGSFGILAGHARMMASLVFGLARYRIEGGPWQYLALPGALIYFVHDELYLSTRRYLKDDDYERISDALHEQLAAEEETLQNFRNSLHNLEQEMLKRLWQIGRNVRKA